MSGIHKVRKRKHMETIRKFYVYKATKKGIMLNDKDAVSASYGHQRHRTSKYRITV
jgi:hypothetical protein